MSSSPTDAEADNFAIRARSIRHCMSETDRDCVKCLSCQEPPAWFLFTKIVDAHGGSAHSTARL